MSDLVHRLRNCDGRILHVWAIDVSYDPIGALNIVI